MKVSRWGNSLAVRLPASVVEVLALKEGDDLTITVTSGCVHVERDRSREEALARLAASDWTLPPGFRFDREEINEK